MIDVDFSIDEMTICFKGLHADKIRLCTKQKVMDTRPMLFLRKDKHIKYLCAMILCKS